MSLRELIAGVEAHEMTLTVLNASEAVVDELREQYRDRNLKITLQQLDGGPQGFAVLSRDGEFVTAVDIEDIRPATDQLGRGDDTTVYRPVLDYLDETMFTSYSIRQMFLASREIEDRAWRIGRGSLHAGFQTLEVLAGQTMAYNQLGEHSDLEVHAYAAPVGENPIVPNHDHYQIHIERADEIRKTWFVVYDGNGLDTNKCALLAEERGDRKFYGFWSYDPQTVDYLIGYLHSVYGFVETDGSSRAA